MYFRKSRDKKVRNFSVEDFKMMATYGVFCFAAESGEVKVEETPVEPKVEAEAKPEAKVEEKPEQDYYYTVQKGDSLGKISGLYGSTPEKFKESNPELIKDINNISVGAKLRVPRDSSRVTYEFQKGDTGTGIAKKLGVSWKDVESANKGFKWDKAQIGARIYVPRRGQVKSVPQQTQPQAQTQQAVQQPSQRVQSANTAQAQRPRYVREDGSLISTLQNHEAVRDHPVISEGNPWKKVHDNLDLVHDEMMKDRLAFLKMTEAQARTLPPEFWTKEGFKDYLMPFIRQESNDNPNRFDLLSANISEKDWDKAKAHWGLKKGVPFTSQLDGLRKSIPMLIAKGFDGSFVPPNMKKVTYLEPYDKVARFWNGNKQATVDGRVFRDVYASKVEDLRRRKGYYGTYDSTIRRK